MRLACVFLLLAASHAISAGIVFEGSRGPGSGKHIVLISGDEEYRSEEAFPQLAKILANRHGFTCTVLFAIDPANGSVNPNINNNIPGLEVLRKADLMIIMTRWRDLPDDQMAHLERYVESGRPIIGIRTATHAFRLKTSPTYRRWSDNSTEWDGGFGRQVLGETWVSHHGQHGKQSTRAVFAPGAETHPILRGIRTGEIWGPTDVYTVRLPQPTGIQALLLGEVLTGMEPDSAPLEGIRNDPMMPVAWVKNYRTQAGQSARVFTTTMGSAQDMANEAFRRMLVNAVYWSVGLEKKIPAETDVRIVGEYRPSPFKFGGFIPGRTPESFR